MPRPPLDLSALPSLDDVEFIERLGAGAGAGRFRARIAGDADVALILEDTTRIDRARFAAWARALAALDHPGLAPVRRIEDVLEPGFAAFAYIDGQNLEARLALRGEGLAELDALAIVLQAAAAVRAAHAVEVAHGALTPRAVVLVDRPGGLDGAVVVGWTPPLEDDAFADRARADLKALGALLYTALTGVSPPSSHRLDVDGLDGGGGAFDDILMDWVDVERDLGGLGRPALDALADSGRFADVAAFVDALLPHFHRTVEGHIAEAGRALESDRAFMTEVERQRGRLRELEMRARSLRDWLATHAARIERCDGELASMQRRVAALESLETEMGLIAGRASGRRTLGFERPRTETARLDARGEDSRFEPRRDWSAPPEPLLFDTPDDADPYPRLTGSLPVAAIDRPVERLIDEPVERPITDSTPERSAPTSTARERATRPYSERALDRSAARRATDHGPRNLHERETEKFEPPLRPEPPESSGGLNGTVVLGTLGAAVLLGVLGAAWLLADRGEGPAPSGPAPTVQQAAVTAGRSAGSASGSAAGAVNAAANTPPPAPAPAPADAPTALPAAAQPDAPGPVVTFTEPVPPDPAPLTPPAGMIAIPAGLVQPGLDDPRRAAVRAQCIADLEGYPKTFCDERFPPDAEPLVDARLAGPFFIDAQEVSQGRYRECSTAGVCEPPKLTWDLDAQPTTGVTRDMAAAYCKWRGGRLPTADEWLLAARGQDGRLYPWGDEPPGTGRDARANYGRFTHKGGLPERGDRHKYAAPVELLADRGLSPYGAQAMAGNVMEWTATVEDGEAIVMGGGWREAPFELRVTRRERLPPDTARNDLGLRCAIDPGEDE